MRIKRKRCYPTFSFDIFMETISHLFVCLPTLELTTFEQQVCSTIIDNENALSLRETGKKGNVATLSGAHQAKQQCNFDIWLIRTTAGNLRTKLKESTFKINNQIHSTVTWL